jgi:alkaline phosphatase D
MTDRRAFIKTTLASGVTFALPAFGQQAPAIVTSERMRPQAISGLQIGDVSADRALVWSRADRPARKRVHGLRAKGADQGPQRRDPVRENPELAPARRACAERE